MIIFFPLVVVLSPDSKLEILEVLIQVSFKSRFVKKYFMCVFDVLDGFLLSFFLVIFFFFFPVFRRKTVSGSVYNLFKWMIFSTPSEYKLIPSDFFEKRKEMRKRYYMLHRAKRGRKNDRVIGRSWNGKKKEKKERRRKRRKKRRRK